jgi:hypothetical protein
LQKTNEAGKKSYEQKEKDKGKMTPPRNMARAQRDENAPKNIGVKGSERIMILTIRRTKHFKQTFLRAYQGRPTQKVNSV